MPGAGRQALLGQRPEAAGTLEASGRHSRGAARTPSSSPGALVWRGHWAQNRLLWGPGRVWLLWSQLPAGGSAEGEVAPCLEPPACFPARGPVCPQPGAPQRAPRSPGPVATASEPAGALEAGEAPAARAGPCTPCGFVTPVARPGPPWRLAGDSAHRSRRRSPGTACWGRGAQATAERAGPRLLQGSGGQGQSGTSAVPGVQWEDSRPASVWARLGCRGGAGRDPGSSWRVVPVLPRSLQEGHLPMGTAGVSWLWLQQTLPGARSSQPHCHLQGWLMGAAHPAPGGRPGVGPREPGPCSGTALGRLPGTRDKMEAGLGRGRRDKAALCGLGPERRPGPCSAASEGPVSPAGTGAPPRGGSREGPLLPAGPLPACPPGALSLGFLSVCWGDATFAHTRGRPGLHTLAGAMGTEPFPRGLCRPGRCGAPGLAAPAGPPVAVPAGPAEGGRKIPGPVALGVGGGEGQGLRPAW